MNLLKIDTMKQLYFGDNLDIMKKLHSDHPEGFIDLIYIDPPFNSKRNYNVLFEDIDLKDTKAQKEAFSDTWSNVSYNDTLMEIQELDLDLYKFIKALDEIRISKSAISYLTTMAIRIHYMHKLLKKTGSFYLHCDPTMSHYLKLVCDLVFGINNFRNEIVWCYRKWSASNNRYLRSHDIILFYGKSNINTFNVQYLPYSEGTFKRWKGKKQASEFKDGVRVHQFSTAEDSIGTYMPDWWEVSIINPAAKERLGYPTQKPIALMERIILASSTENDLVADFFCGCGTTIAAAEKLNRNWMGVDISHLAVKLIIDRLVKPYPELKQQEIRKNIHVDGFPKDIASALELAQNTDKHRVQFQDWIIEFMIGGVSNTKKSGDGGFDGYITFALPESEKRKGIAIIEVKSGNVGIATLRAFMNVVEKQKADIGVFVCFANQVTSGMQIEANNKGKIGNHPKIQIVTVDDLLDGKRPSFPYKSETTVYAKSTTRLDKEQKESGLFD
ncbi:MAG TPA: site-specific DNA-methyltransferase [Spirochaetia bacterium]|nr:site-specific DNA-methyltransferase [Spirochaetia bacterium]